MASFVCHAGALCSAFADVIHRGVDNVRGDWCLTARLPSMSTNLSTGIGPKNSPGVAAVRAYLVASGGIAGYGEMVAATSWRAVRDARLAGVVVLRRRGLYALADADAVASSAPLDQTAFEPAVLARRRSERASVHRQEAELGFGARSHRSAAEHYELPVLVEPSRTEVIVPRGRRLLRSGRKVTMRRRDLTDRERRNGVTDPLRTVLDCAADLPFAEALAIADSALRSAKDTPSLVARSQLIEGLGSVARRSLGRARRVIEAADGRAANPFESAVRALALDVPGLTVEPQVTIVVDGTELRVDLADRSLRIVIEADSYAWHSSRMAFSRDCDRYSSLIADDWLVLRLTWRAVMLHPERTRRQVAAVVALREAQLGWATGVCRQCLRAAG